MHEKGGTFWIFLLKIAEKEGENRPVLLRCMPNASISLDSSMREITPEPSASNSANSRWTALERCSCFSCAVLLAPASNLSQTRKCDRRLFLGGLWSYGEPEPEPPTAIPSVESCIWLATWAGLRCARSFDSVESALREKKRDQNVRNMSKCGENVKKTHPAPLFSSADDGIRSMAAARWRTTSCVTSPNLVNSASRSA